MKIYIVSHIKIPQSTKVMYPYHLNLCACKVFMGLALMHIKCGGHSSKGFIPSKCNYNNDV